MSVDWIDTYVAATEKLPSPRIYRLWSAITAISGVLERKVWTQGSGGAIYPNLFTILVGPPTAGKTIALGPIRELWGKVTGLHIAPDNVTKASLIDALQKSMRTIINGGTDFDIFSALNVAVSEFGVFFTHHDLEFLSVLNHVYDAPPSYREERRTIEKPIEVIRPHLVILACTQPDFLGTFLPDEAWGMGFTSRLILIYAQGTPVADLFNNEQIHKSQTLSHGLNKIFTVKGMFQWTDEAKVAINTWNQHGGAPAPTHSKLRHYKGRRTLHTIKLSMISAASRNNGLSVELQDFNRAKAWLLEAEKTMPDIFTAMEQKSDTQVINDLHFYIYQLYISRPMDKRKPITESEIYNFLERRVPSGQIAKIIEVAEKAGHLRRAMYPGEYLPGPMKGNGQ